MTIRQQFNVPQQRMEYSVVPEFIPSVPEHLSSVDSHILVVHLVPSGSGGTVSIYDANNSPVIVPDTPVNGSTGDFLQVFQGRLASGGISWSATGTVVGFVSWF